MKWRFRVNLLPLAAMFLMVVSVAAAAIPKPVPVVLDTDIGTDIDDAFALALILRSPEINLLAVTTVSGDTQARARLAARMLWVEGRRDIPVAAGVDGAPMPIAQTRWADGFTSPQLLSEPAVDLMKAEIDRGHGEVVIVAIGPLTNVAALLTKYPGEEKKIRRIVLMGRSIAHGYYPNSGPTAEYNIAADAKASRVVFTSGVPIEMAPLDVTWHLQLDAANQGRIYGQGTPLANALRAIDKLWGQPTPTLHDPMAVGLLLNSELATLEPLHIRIAEDGRTVVVAGKPANAVVAVENNPARFIGFYTRRLTRRSTKSILTKK
jgi:purine nucleosidase